MPCSSKTGGPCPPRRPWIVVPAVAISNSSNRSNMNPVSPPGPAGAAARAVRLGSLARQLSVGVVRVRERERRLQPVLKCGVELGVVAARVGVWGDPPADVDVAGQELVGQRRAAPHRVQVAAAEVAAGAVLQGVSE